MKTPFLSPLTFFRELPRRAFEIAKEVALVVPVGVASGSASALFLWALDRTTEVRWNAPWLLFLLPLGGVVVGWVYWKVGDRSTAGNNLILEEIHNPGGGVQRRMAPLVLGATLVTHLFGGSAGREGTAVQMGGSLAGGYARFFKMEGRTLRLILMAGIAAGFGSVFGTPLTGAVFAVEVLIVGEMRHEALVPLFVASFVADFTCRAWGIHHSSYSLSGVDLEIDSVLLLKALGVGVACGLTGLLFTTVERTVKRGAELFISKEWLRPFFGGLAVIALAYLLGTNDYLGLSVAPEHPYSITLRSCFDAGGATPWSWWWKLLFTAVTLGFGFKGGEVTPLFFIGAALGNVLASVFGLPVALCAALGFVAVFAGASNTPFACTLMAVELFGGRYTALFAASCFAAYLFSGYDGLYKAQRGRELKRGLPVPFGSGREGRL